MTSETQDRPLDAVQDPLLETVAPVLVDVSVAESYAACREIAKREAKNFYYSFVALPRHKSDAMCAVYAFMRKADDLSDDESKAACADVAMNSPHGWPSGMVPSSGEPASGHCLSLRCLTLK